MVTMSTMMTIVRMVAGASGDDGAGLMLVVSWWAAERLLGGCWTAARRLLDGCWAAAGRLLDGCWAAA
jgi:hypothetical protein